MTAIAWGFLLRLGQVTLEAALTLVVGVVVAGVLRRMLGPAGTRGLFGRGWHGLFRGWLAGMLLPVCSLGVIPVAREMARAGVPGGTVLAFVLAAPLLNPMSFLYGLTLAEPIVIVSFAVLSLALSTLAGLLWDRVFAGPAAEAEAEARARAADAEPAPSAGPRRVLAVFATAAKELTGRDLVFYAVGLVGSALLAAVIPFGSLQGTMKHSDWTSPLLMAAVSIPVFSSPLPGMMKMGLMFDHGNSLAAAFVLFALGIGVCLGTLAWLFVDFGPRRVVPWFATYVGVVLAMGYAADPVLYDTRKAEVEHTHAFDDYSCPFPASSGPEVAATVWLKLAERFGPLERPAVYALLALVLAGAVLRAADRGGAVERWLTAPDPHAGRPRPAWDVVVPGPVLGAVTLAGLVAFSVVGAYLYYPDRAYCLEVMASQYADAAVAVKTGKSEEAVRCLEQWDLTTRKLQVGEYIRAFRLSPEQARTPDDLREAMEVVRDHLRDGQPDAAKAAFPAVETAYRACKAAFPKP